MKSVVMFVFFVSVASLGTWAYAACGESRCFFVGDQFACVVEGPSGELQLCTETDPCSVNCPG